MEDNPEVAEVTAALLEQLGYLTRVVGDAEAALQQLDLGETFDLVFSDIVMAGPLDGTGLGRAIRERFPGLPVLLATGYAKAGDAAHGEFPTLRKPYQTAELDRAVGKLIAEAQRRMNETNLIQFRDPRKDRYQNDFDQTASCTDSMPKPRGVPPTAAGCHASVTKGRAGRPI